MQDVDRPAHVQAPPQPARRGSPRVQDEPLRSVPRPQKLHGIARHFKRRRDFWQNPAIRAAEPKLAVGLSIELVALLVDGAVVPATEQSEIRECGGTSLCPVDL